MRNFKMGDKVRHFKDGVYIVLGEGVHTETGERLMIYQSGLSYEYFARPYDMFMEKVDKEKYPNAIQEYRLEKITQHEYELELLKLKEKK